MDALTRMQAFVQVVDAGGFSAAARRAGKSKALLSKYVRDLEDELGVRLLNRTTRQLSPTEVGLAYHREAVELLQRLDDLTASVRDSHGEPRGHLRISGPRFFGLAAEQQRQRESGSGKLASSQGSNPDSHQGRAGAQGAADNSGTSPVDQPDITESVAPISHDLRRSSLSHAPPIADHPHASGIAA